MSRPMDSGKCTVCVVVLAACCGVAAQAAAAAKVGDVLDVGARWLVAQVQSQTRVDILADQRQDLVDQYRSTLRESEGLRLYIRQLDLQIKSQLEEMDVVRAETRELERTAIEVLPLMQKMLESLEAFVELDVPFLLEDRRKRVALLKELMPRGDVTVSEKYRKIIEAYQLEAEYGRTIEAYRGELEGRTVDFLRVGRVALLYQSPDGQDTGYWDAEKKAWVEDDDYAKGVTDGLRIARKQTSPDLLIVPILAAKKGGQ